MKRFYLLLIAFATLSYTTSDCIERDKKMFALGCGVIVGTIAGTYYYYKHYKPVHTPSDKSPIQHLLVKPPVLPDQTGNPVTNTPTILILTPSTQEKDITESGNTNIAEPTFTTQELATKIVQGYLNNMCLSLERIDFESLLLENMDVLEG